LIYGTGYSDLFSIVLMPSYDLTDKIELVGRYTFSTSEDDDGVRLQKRYESSAALNPRGDTYHAIYGGITYRICGDKLKLMTGVEYSTLSGGDADYDGLTYFAGVRTQF
jgi:phosphate-selective porin OprO/OprP